jgi:hypothetical protein
MAKEADAAGSTVTFMPPFSHTSHQRLLMQVKVLINSSPLRNSNSELPILRVGRQAFFAAFELKS